MKKENVLAWEEGSQESGHMVMYLDHLMMYPNGPGKGKWNNKYGTLVTLSFIGSMAQMTIHPRISEDRSGKPLNGAKYFRIWPTASSAKFWIYLQWRDQKCIGRWHWLIRVPFTMMSVPIPKSVMHKLHFVLARPEEREGGAESSDVDLKAKGKNQRAFILIMHQ